MLRSLFRLQGAAPAAIAISLAVFSACSQPAESPDAAEASAAVSEVFPFSHDPERLQAVGPEACVECHAAEVADWQRSHHAKANRAVDPVLDRAAFEPGGRIRESGVTYQLTSADSGYQLEVIDADGGVEHYNLAGVIGYTPLRQYLATFPGGRFQTISPSYDVIEKQWFDVYQGQDRMPGEWGHWTGQGMNWNANCAYCHTTEFHKHYDFELDRYATRWTHQGIGCLECHSNMDTHVKAAAIGDDRAGLVALSREQAMDNCFTCHARRDQLTADAFKLGDRYEDHFSLSTAEQPGLYYADGQILDEVFVHGSFSMSRMAHAGVTCFDCHDPHTMDNMLPVENNMLCMRCHETGVAVGAVQSPIIDTLAHGHHPEGSVGNRCVECHMPKTTYMEVDPRADHGFHVPDPLMTRELGIPNACARCHDERAGEGLDWQIEWAEKWYGETLAGHRQRERARAIHAARELEPEAYQALLQLADDETIPFWRATYVGLLGQYSGVPAVAAHIRAAADDPHHLVRDKSANALTQIPGGDEALERLLADPVRGVRISAARSLDGMGVPLPKGRAADDLEAYLKFNADRPQSLFILAQRAAREQDSARTLALVERALNMDQLNARAYRDAAILTSMSGNLQDPERLLKRGWDLAPESPEFPYLLGLLRAEQGKLDETITYLQEAVALDPAFSRAWYNLSLSYLKLDRLQEAEQALIQAAPAMRNDPSWIQVYRLIQGRLAAAPDG